MRKHPRLFRMLQYCFLYPCVLCFSINGFSLIEIFDFGSICTYFNLYPKHQIKEKQVLLQTYTC